MRCVEARGCFRHVDDVMVTSLVRRPCVSSCIHPLRSLTRPAARLLTEHRRIDFKRACMCACGEHACDARTRAGWHRREPSVRACVRQAARARPLRHRFDYQAPAAPRPALPGSTGRVSVVLTNGGGTMRAAETLTRRPTSYSRTHCSAGDTGSLAAGRRVHACISLPR